MKYTILYNNVKHKMKVAISTLGPEDEKLIIPGKGLIWAPLSLPITWKGSLEQVKETKNVINNLSQVAHTHTYIYRSNKEDLYLSSLSHIFRCPFTAEFPIILNILVMGLHVKFVQYFSLHKNFPYNIKKLIRLLEPAKMIVLREELYILKEQSKIQLQAIKLRK